LAADESAHSILSLIPRIVDRAIAETGISKEQLLGLGLAVPGPIDIEAGCLLNVPNLNDWANHPIRSELEELLNLPVLLDEDVTAIVLGEQWCGWGTEYHNVLYLYVGIGIGLGIVSNGHPLRGWKGNIGQIGHVQIDPAGPLCHCGKRGCLEAYCTADAILRDARIATLNRDHPAGPDLPKLPHRIEDVVGSDDPIFVEVLKQAAKRLGTVLSDAIAILDPELVLLGGEMIHRLGDSFVETLILEIPKSAMPTKPLPPVKSSSFGADAGVIGAATLVLHDAYAPSLQLLNLI
jgi:predicted NBD/HSP70 family sugar kinase